MGRIYDATWGRAFSALYDSGLRAAEEAGLARMRAELLAGAEGRVVELGAGTGANLEHYPELEELVLVEPDPHMTKRLRERLAGSGRKATIVEAPAERLPLEPGSFDTAVVTLVLCTVPDPVATIAEIARVLKPGGRLLFIEHVRAEDPSLARWQDRLERPWRFFADGCRCNRDTLATITASRFELGEVEHDRTPKAVPIVEPLVRGSASLGA
ncbi:MAG TPA: class I SAM-dependent methyltransferase [Solirubrobacterales bacterium]|nr:class I SAM-dependent methyltransferase [Solirubrobacterales bacterium]